MISRFLLVLGLLFLQVSGAGTEDYIQSKKPNSIGIIIGSGILGMEFMGLPLLDRYLNWGKPPRLNNPFKNIKESEPYHQDEMWHFVGAASTADLNYSVLHEFYGVEHPLFTSAAISFLFWTWMECLDGMSGSGFSVRDEIANVSGVAFSMLKNVNPDFPVFVRIGVWNWAGMAQIISDGDPKKLIGSKYKFTKVEIIYMAQNNLYAGLALSNQEKPKGPHEDKLGITVGYDLVRSLNELKKGWWNGSVGFLTDHLNISLNFTFWIN